MTQALYEMWVEQATSCKTVRDVISSLGVFVKSHRDDSPFTDLQKADILLTFSVSAQILSLREDTHEQETSVPHIPDSAGDRTGSADGSGGDSP